MLAHESNRQGVERMHLQNLYIKLKQNIPNVKRTGGRHWAVVNALRTKSRYYRVQDAVLKDKRDSDIAIGDEEFRNVMYGYMTKWIEMTTKSLNPKLLKSKTLEYPMKLIKWHKTSKSAFNVDGLYEVLPEYQNARKKRKPVVVTDRAKKIILAYLIALSDQVEIIRKKEPFEQEEIILANIQSGKNIGFPFYAKQDKKTFKGLLFKYLAKIHAPFPEQYLTVDFIEKLTKYFNDNELYPPSVLFYRTQGGAKTKIRCVFGGHIINKLIGALIHAAKSETKSPRIGSLPAIMKEDWGVYFDNLIKVISTNKHLFWMGEDFTGFDEHIISSDLRWLENEEFGIMKIFVVYVLNNLENGDVWTGFGAVPDTFFISGHPFTSDFGSFVHIILMFMYESVTPGVRVEHATVQSDDNITAWSGDFSMADYLKFLKNLGFTVSLGKTFSLQRDLVVSFLKIWVGYIFDDENITYIGDLTSRYYGLLHAERDIEDEESDVGIWRVTGDIVTDQVLSKLASLGFNGLPYISAMLSDPVVKDTQVARKVIVAINVLKSGALPVRPSRNDVPVGLSPKLLAEVDIAPILP